MRYWSLWSWLCNIRRIPNANVPKIITAHNEKEVLERLDDMAFAISGKLSNTLEEFETLPVINTMDNVERLVDLIEEKVYDKLPDFPEECCDKCGYNCRQLGAMILKGQAKGKIVYWRNQSKTSIDGKI